MGNTATDFYFGSTMSCRKSSDLVNFFNFNNYIIKVSPESILAEKVQR